MTTIYYNELQYMHENIIAIHFQQWSPWLQYCSLLLQHLVECIFQYCDWHCSRSGSQMLSLPRDQCIVPRMCQGISANMS